VPDNIRQRQPEKIGSGTCARKHAFKSMRRAAQLKTSGVRTSGGEALSAFGAARLDNSAPGPRGHPRTKAVPASTLQAAWLECTLHNCCSSRFRVRPGAVCSESPRQVAG
jgi:hypothetical protein